ncbi:hypothetical protein, partial [Streptococcus mutans]|uniref:hypothetical protein n=1 Tax=Streptococcus mutans TaxID=1309 RepID=UPI0034A3A0A1
NPQSAIRNPQSAIRNPQSAIRNPQSAIRTDYVSNRFFCQLLIKTFLHFCGEVFFAASESEEA